MLIGLDLIELERIERALRREGFRSRVYTEAERVYCESRANPVQSYAGRFAAKEAVGKALGRGMTRWREVEVIRGRGAPTVALHGHYAEWAVRLGVDRIHLSLTHSKGLAAAVAVAETDPGAA